MPKPCRYLEEGTCLYWDMELRGDEDIKCYPGGWDCYEAPNGSGALYEGRWMTEDEAIEYYQSKLPEELEGVDWRINGDGIWELFSRDQWRQEGKW